MLKVGLVNGKRKPGQQFEEPHERKLFRLATGLFEFTK
jgi:hypothetical protein